MPYQARSAADLPQVRPRHPATGAAWLAQRAFRLRLSSSTKRHAVLILRQRLRAISSVSCPSRFAKRKATEQRAVEVVIGELKLGVGLGRWLRACGVLRHVCIAQYKASTHNACSRRNTPTKCVHAHTWPPMAPLRQWLDLTPTVQQHLYFAPNFGSRVWKPGYIRRDMGCSHHSTFDLTVWLLFWRAVRGHPQGCAGSWCPVFQPRTVCRPRLEARGRFYNRTPGAPMAHHPPTLN